MESGGEVRRREARVVEKMPNEVYRLELEDRTMVLAHAASRRERDFLRLLPGDRVVVELSPRDPGRGRITQRCRS